jgi:dihydroxy-acid dehydratase
MSHELKTRSWAITDGTVRAGARAMLKAAGYSDDDLARPVILPFACWQPR